MCGGQDKARLAFSEERMTDVYRMVGWYPAAGTLNVRPAEGVESALTTLGPPRWETECKGRMNLRWWSGLLELTGRSELNAGVRQNGDGGGERVPRLVRSAWALVLGGGAAVWDEVLAWEAIYGKQWDGLVVAANDVGSHWPRSLDHWVTLHPNRLPGWEGTRKHYGFPDGYVTWGRRLDHTDHCIKPWAGGSSGMLAIQVAAQVGCVRAVLCGIPMTATPHFTESFVHLSEPWTAVASHWKAWLKNGDKVQGWVRSMSGMTEHFLGTPTVEWLLGEEV